MTTRAAAEVAVLEAEVAVALLAAGIPPDVTRPPTDVELASRCDFAAIDQRITTAGRALGELAAGGRGRAVEWLGAELQARVAGGASRDGLLAWLDRLYRGTVRPLFLTELAAEVEAAALRVLLAVVDGAGQDVAVELDAQGITAGPPDLDGARREARQRARALGIEAVQHAIRTVREAALRRPTPPPEPAMLIEWGGLGFVGDVVSAAARMTLGLLFGEGTRAATSVQATARVGALSQITSPALIYASELLDRSTCIPCDRVDGREYGTMRDALVDYPAGQYLDCLGGDRCRGTLVTVAPSETPATMRR